MSFKWWLFTVISLFAIGILFGATTYRSVPASLNTQTADLQSLTEMILSLPKPVMMAAIFIKNLLAVVVSIILSPVLLLVPMLTLLINGWLVGILSAAVIHEQSVGYLLAGLLPHGVFELPALFMGEAVAFSIGAVIIRALLNGHTAELKTTLMHNMR